MIVDSIRSSPQRESRHYQSVSSNYSDSHHLDPIIHYNPKSSEQRPHQTQSVYVNPHRRKIFQNRTSNTKNTPKPLVVQQNKPNEIVIQQLIKIENKLQQIQQSVTYRQKGQTQNIDITIRQQQKQLNEKNQQIQQTQRKIVSMIVDKQKTLKDMDKLREVLAEKDRKTEQNRLKENQKEVLIRKQMQYQFLLGQQKRVQAQYSRIKNGALRKQDYQIELEKIKRRALNRALKRNYVYDSVSSNSSLLPQYQKSTNYKLYKQSPNKKQQSSLSHNITQSKNRIDLNKTNDELYITNSLIYPFEQEQKILLA